MYAGELPGLAPQNTQILTFGGARSFEAVPVLVITLFKVERPLASVKTSSVLSESGIVPLEAIIAVCFEVPRKGWNWELVVCFKYICTVCVQCGRIRPREIESECGVTYVRAVLSFQEDDS